MFLLFLRSLPDTLIYGTVRSKRRLSFVCFFRVRISYRVLAACVYLVEHNGPLAIQVFNKLCVQLSSSCTRAAETVLFSLRILFP